MMNAHIRGDETIKVALVGCGSRGTGAVTQALGTKGPIKLWAMADLFSDKLETSLAALCKGQKASYDVTAQLTGTGLSDLRPGMAVRVDWPGSPRRNP